MIDTAVSFQLAGALLHSLWLGLLAALLAWYVCRFIVRTPGARYFVLVAALLFTVLSVPFAYIWIKPPESIVTLSPSDSTLHAAPVGTPSPSSIVTNVAGPLLDTTSVVSDDASARTFSRVASLQARSPDSASRFHRETWSHWLVAAWVAGILLMSMRLGATLGRSRSLVARSRNVSEMSVIRLFRDAAQRLEVGVLPRLVWCSEITVPAVIGVARPVILLPAAAVTGVSTSQLESLLLHELAHIKRRDPWVNFLQLLGETVCFYNPAIWFISSRIRKEREHCCDDAVIGSGIDSLCYADALVAAAQRACGSDLGACGNDRANVALMGAVAHRGSQLSERIDRVLGRRATSPTLVQSAAFGVALIIPLVVVASWVVAANPPSDATSRVASQDGETTHERDRLIKQLESPDANHRRAAMRAFAEQPLHDDLRHALRMLSDSDQYTRTAAFSVIASLKDQRAVEPLLQQLEKKDRNETASVIRALAAIGDPRAVEPIAEVIRGDDCPDEYGIRDVANFDDPRIRDALFSRLPKEGPVNFNLVSILVRMDDRRLIPRMLDRIKTEDRRRSRAINTLGSLKATEAVVPLTEMITNPSASDRQRDDDDEACALALATIGDASAVPALRSLLDRAVDDDVLESAIKALGRFGDTEALPKITQLAQHDDNQVRSAAEEAVGDIALGANKKHLDIGLRAALQIARGGLSDDDGATVAAAIRFLTQHDDEEANTLIVPFVRDDRQPVRTTAIMALVYQSHQVVHTSVLDAIETLESYYKRKAAAAIARSGDRRALPLLEKMAGDKNEYLVRAVAEELWNFGPDVNPVLCELLSATNHRTRYAALESLVKIADETTLDALIACGNAEAKKGAQEMVIRSLGRVQDPRSIEYLVGQLNDPKQNNTRAAARALARLGWHPQSDGDRVRYLVATGQANDPSVPRTVTKDQLVEGEFRLNLPIQTEISVGTDEWPAAVRLNSIVFHQRAGRLIATLGGGRQSWPPMTIRSQLRLLDDNGDEIASVRSEKELGGYIISVISQTSMELEFDLGRVDIAKIKRFEILIDDVPQNDSDIAIDEPPRAAMSIGKSIPIRLTAKRGDRELIKFSSLRLDAEESENPRRRTFKASLDLVDGVGIDAEWRVWVVAVDESGKVVGRGGYGHKFSTQLDRDLQPKNRSLKLPFSTWSTEPTAHQLRVGLELVAVNTGVEENRVTETVDHQVPPGAEATVLDDGSAEGKRSLAASGHALRFDRAGDGKFLEAVDIFASRYGMLKPPTADFYLYVLDGKQKVISELKYPYSLIPRGDLQWHTIRTPSIELPEQYHIAFAFNPHRTKGIYLGYDDSPSQSNSYQGIAGDGFTPLEETHNWMIRPYLVGDASAELGTRLLKDRPAESVADPFVACIEANAVVGESAGRQSYGGAGPVIDISIADVLPDNTPLESVRLKGIRLFASRYGSGHDPKEPVDLILVDGDAKTLWSHSFPYERFGYREKWVDLVIPEPVSIEQYLRDGKLAIAIDPHAHQRKGLYFHYVTASDDDASSRGIVPGKRFFDFKGRRWMIRAFLTIEHN